uniref:Uncharacterized protein n=1 Tax=viral metagenome TaxID=1070528 RepID=A0A6H1ZV18_9ZZZZ
MRKIVRWVVLSLVALCGCAPITGLVVGKEFIPARPVLRYREGELVFVDDPPFYIIKVLMSSGKIKERYVYREQYLDYIALGDELKR